MFSFLDMINSSLSYFNLDAKLKSRIYIIIATLGDGYLVYVTFRLFMNHVWLRASCTAWRCLQSLTSST